MMGHKICFDGVILIIIPKLFLFPLLIWSTVVFDFEGVGGEGGFCCCTV